MPETAGVVRMAADEDERLSQIATHWSLLLRAHAGSGDDRRVALGELLLRYHAPVYRYLRGLVGSDGQAEELCQEFALRFLRGDFHRADPNRGRFRNYLKAALQHLAGERARRRPPPLSLNGGQAVPSIAAPPPGGEHFVDLWRQELLNRAWAALAERSAARGDHFYEVLRLKADDPTRTSAALAEELARRHGRPVTAAGVRQTLHRARSQFVEFLRAEVAASVPTTDPAAVDAELADLRLLAYCDPGG
jgi:DNA-directed RNA polymerase specialized sigma24 family protein